MYSEMSDLKTEMAELKQRVGSVEEQGGMYLNITYDCFITKTCPCNVYPLIPHFYIAKLGFAGIYLFFLFLLKNIDFGYLLEPPRRAKI